MCIFQLLRIITRLMSYVRLPSKDTTRNGLNGRWTCGAGKVSKPNTTNAWFSFAEYTRMHRIRLNISEIDSTKGLSDSGVMEEHRASKNNNKKRIFYQSIRARTKFEHCALATPPFAAHSILFANARSSNELFLAHLGTSSPSITFCQV